MNTVTVSERQGARAVGLKPEEANPVRVMIVEDEILIALDIERTLEDLGFDVVGVAGDENQASTLAHEGADVALVDLNLRDGLSGIRIGSVLAKQGISVVFMTANPDQLDAPVPGALGVLSKPVSEEDMRQTAHFVAATRRGRAAAPPKRMQSLPGSRF